MKAKVTFTETELSVSECESIVLDAIGNVDSVTGGTLGDSRATSTESGQNIDVYAEFEDKGDADDGRSAEERIEERLQDDVDGRLYVSTAGQ